MKPKLFVVEEIKYHWVGLRLNLYFLPNRIICVFRGHRYVPCGVIRGAEILFCCSKCSKVRAKKETIEVFLKGKNVSKRA